MSQKVQLQGFQANEEFYFSLFYFTLAYLINVYEVLRIRLETSLNIVKYRLLVKGLIFRAQIWVKVYHIFCGTIFHLMVICPCEIVFEHLHLDLCIGLFHYLIFWTTPARYLVILVDCTCGNRKLEMWQETLHLDWSRCQIWLLYLILF